jgi:AcrR family transcriptional regulator
MMDRPYHHGDLRSALLAAAEAELLATGPERFSLRSVAKRAGVSHAAPAHHFGDADGLLTALTVEGFHRLLSAQSARERVATSAPRAQLIASGLGYIDFALAHPALFRLMFASDRPKHGTPTLYEAGKAAFDHLIARVGSIGAKVRHDGQVTADVAAAWAIVHGLADLMRNGSLVAIATLPGADRDAVLTGIIDRAIPES